MIDKVWYIIMFMYIFSFSMLGIQWVLLDPFGLNMQTFVDVYDPINNITIPAGTELRPLFHGSTNYDTLNGVAGRASTGNYQTSDGSPFDKVINYATAAAFLAWDVMTLLTGTQIFFLMFLLGVPYIFVAGFVFIYVFFLIRTAIALIRGV